MNPSLSVILFDVFELEPSYLDSYFKALSAWNQDGLGDAQVIVISQRRTTEAAEEAAKRYNVPALFVPAGHEFVADYPIWDVLASIRKVWRDVTGCYVTFNHPEFIWGPGRLRKTIDWLKEERPYFALGNLRRPGSHAAITGQQTSDHNVKELSEVLRLALQDDEANAAKIFERMETSWWMFWTQQEQEPGSVRYIEDVFFADKEWLDAWQFTEHGGELPFQDVYDLIKAAMTAILPRHGLDVQCVRTSNDVNRMLHLWHPKMWLSWTPEIRDWFLSDRQRWQGTLYLNPFMWRMLINVRAAMPKTYQPVNDLRNGPGGTVTRYRQALDRFMQNGGRPHLEEFYRKHGRQRREA